jgi:hypothetical protein
MTTETAWTRPNDRLLPLALELLDVDTASGICRWKNNNGRARAGAIAGCVTKHGYAYISVNGVGVMAHRIVWFAKHGTPPPVQIDHASQERDARGALSNAIANLRDGSGSANMSNCKPRRDNTSGFPGVSWHKRERKWQVQISRNGRVIPLGLFASPFVAWLRYVAVKFVDHPTSARCDLPGRVEAARAADE